MASKEGDRKEGNNREFDLSPAASPHIVTIDKGKLQRVLNSKDLFTVGYGDLGSSIYYALGVTIIWAAYGAPYAIAIAGAFFLCTVLSYTELATAIPDSGGCQLFARRAFNSDLASFVAGWSLLLDYILTIAISAFTIAPYLGYFISPLKSDISIHVLFTIGVISFLAFINIIGIKLSTTINLILAVLDISTRVVLLLLGFLFILNLEPIVYGIRHIGQFPTWGNFIYGVSVAMVAYTGIEAASQLAGEVKSPAKSVPKAMMSIMVIMVVFSIAMVFLVLSILTPKEMENWVNDPIAGLVQAISKNLTGIPLIAKLLPPLVAILAAVVLLIATNAGVIGGSRLTYSMSNMFQLPLLFRNLHTKLKTPYRTILLVTVIAILIVLFAKDIKILADLYNFGAMMAFSLTHLSTIALRIKEPELHRPFKIPFNIKIKGKEIPIPSVIGFLGTASALIVIIITHHYSRFFGLSWLVIGIILYYRYRKSVHVPVAKQLEIEKIKFEEFQQTQIKKILLAVSGTESYSIVEYACKIAKSFGAEITAIYVVEVPLTLDLDTIIGDEFYKAQLIMKRVQAIGSEMDIYINILILQSHSAEDTILSNAEKYDMLILGNLPKLVSTFSSKVSYIVKNISKPVLIYSRQAKDIKEEETILPYRVIKKLSKR